MKTTSRTLRIGAGAGTAALAFLFVTSSVAAAHVGLAGSSTAAGASSVLTLSSSHGCDTSPTTEFAIKIPTELNTATPTQLAGWNVQKVMQQLNTPITGSHGSQITERVDQIVYTAAEPLADGVRVAFEVSVQLPENAAGSTLYFPTIQRCVQGQNDWIEIPASGQDHDELESPAPALAVTAATGADGHGSAGGTEADPADPAVVQEVTNQTTPAGNSGTTLSIVALVAGLAGLLLGGAAFLRGRPRT